MLCQGKEANDQSDKVGRFFSAFSRSTRSQPAHCPLRFAPTTRLDALRVKLHADQTHPRSLEDATARRPAERKRRRPPALGIASLVRAHTCPLTHGNDAGARACSPRLRLAPSLRPSVPSHRFFFLPLLLLQKAQKHLTPCRNFPSAQRHFLLSPAFSSFPCDSSDPKKAAERTQCIRCCPPPSSRCCCRSQGRSATRPPSPAAPPSRRRAPAAPSSATRTACCRRNAPRVSRHTAGRAAGGKTGGEREKEGKGGKEMT